MKIENSTSFLSIFKNALFRRITSNIPSEKFDDLHFGSFIQYIFITANVVLLTLKRRVFIVAVFL